MDKFQLVIFDQTRCPQCCLGPWWSWQGDLAQLLSAARQLLKGPNPGSIRLFTLSGQPALILPGQHDLPWGDSLEGEEEVQEAEATSRLHRGHGLQLFLYNGDSDCIRHLLALPLSQPAPWFPDITR